MAKIRKKSTTKTPGTKPIPQKPIPKKPVPKNPIPQKPEVLDDGDPNKPFDPVTENHPAYHKGILNPQRHYMLVRNLTKYAEAAGVPEHVIYEF